MSKTKAQLEEEIRVLRKKQVSQLKLDELKESLKQYQDFLDSHGIRRPETMLAEIEAVEEKYRTILTEKANAFWKEATKIASDCESITGRPLTYNFNNGELL